MKKTTSTKKSYRYTSKEVAIMCDCSESLVKKIRGGFIGNMKTEKVRLVLEVDTLLYDGSSMLLAEVERILKK